MVLKLVPTPLVPPNYSILTDSNPALIPKANITDKKPSILAYQVDSQIEAKNANWLYHSTVKHKKSKVSPYKSGVI